LFKGHFQKNQNCFVDSFFVTPEAGIVDSVNIMQTTAKAKEPIISKTKYLKKKKKYNFFFNSIN
jgi:hypothetical protein